MTLFYKGATMSPTVTFAEQTAQNRKQNMKFIIGGLNYALVFTILFTPTINYKNSN